ncbi:MAG TPA: hydroxysqualene dehydroxylase HpnE [Beijerinckiaceae bacterium]|nr:hydroxysqualene dehydroxylase HpnE [Beijerinckiaceae bacterium]
MSRPTVHVVGAGLAGLAAAVRLCDTARVELYEAASHAGGRARSYFDAALGIEIDNGNHLVLSGNTAAMAFLDEIGSASELVGPKHSDFAFADLRTGERWTLAINDGPFPWWVFVPGRRVPRTKPADYLAAARLLKAGPAATVADVLGASGSLYKRLWRPFFLAALNTDPAEASAKLAKTVVVETLLKGGRACRPRVAAHGLSRAFVDPATVFLERRDAGIHFNRRVRSLQFDDERVAAIDFGEEVVKLASGDALVLAVPGQIAADLVPGYAGPSAFGAIVNAHFKIAPPPGSPAILGVVGGTVEWLFSFPDRLSVTISGANRLLDVSRESLAADIWLEVAKLTGLPAELPPWQIVKERRATFAATPAENARRPQAATRWSNLALAGDWVANGLPSTIEGAIRSGHAAADILTGRRGAAGLLPKSRAGAGMARS